VHGRCSRSLNPGAYEADEEARGGQPTSLPDRWRAAIASRGEDCAGPSSRAKSQKLWTVFGAAGQAEAALTGGRHLGQDRAFET
jgi:hypothetical protein